MNNKIVICSNPEIRSILIPLLQKIFQVSLEIAEDLYDSQLKAHIDRLRESVWFLIEWPYVDKVYRDSYYTYFSSKLSEYRKDCMLISLFEGEVVLEDFRSEKRVADISGRFRGFMVLRPIVPGMVGRCVVAKEALKEADFIALEAQFPTSVNSVKLVAQGFPYSMQDAEITTCAETVVWEVMEYLSAHYKEYIPILPAAIIDTLKDYMPDRQLPSKGLGVGHMAYVLKKFGVGSRIYAKNQFAPGKFENVISTYVESGLPIILAIGSAGILHAVVAIGYEKTTDAMIDALPTTNETDPEIAEIIAQRKIQLFDNDDLPRKFVFMDDNLPMYQLAGLKTPASNYLFDNWRRCEVSEFIVPLHAEMYLDAELAKKNFKELLFTSQFRLPNNCKVFIRMFLTSSRLFKDRLAKDQSIPKLAKEFMLNNHMPRFIWVGEISNKELIKQRKAVGLFVFDATEPNTLLYSKSLIGALYQHKYYFPNDKVRQLEYMPATFDTFTIFNNNLN